MWFVMKWIHCNLIFFIDYKNIVISTFALYCLKKFEQALSDPLRRRAGARSNASIGDLVTLGVIKSLDYDPLHAGYSLG